MSNSNSNNNLISEEDTEYFQDIWDYEYNHNDQQQNPSIYPFEIPQLIIRGSKKIGSVVQALNCRQTGIYIQNVEALILKQLMLSRRCQRVQNRSQNDHLTTNDYSKHFKANSRLKIIDNKFLIQMENDPDLHGCFKINQDPHASELEKMYSLKCPNFYQSPLTDFDFCENYVHRDGRCQAIVSLSGEEGNKISFFDIDNGKCLNEMLIHPDLHFNRILVSESSIILKANKKSCKAGVNSYFIFINHPLIPDKYHIKIMESAFKSKAIDVNARILTVSVSNYVEVFDLKTILQAELYDDPSYKENRVELQKLYPFPVTHCLTTKPDILFRIKAYGHGVEIVNFPRPYLIKQVSQTVFRISEAKEIRADLKLNEQEDLEFKAKEADDLSLTTVDDFRQIFIFNGNDVFSVLALENIYSDSTEEPFLKEIFKGKLSISNSKPQEPSMTMNCSNPLRKSNRNVARVNYSLDSILQSYSCAFNEFLDQLAIVQFAIKVKCIHIKVWIYNCTPWTLFAALQMDSIKDKFDQVNKNIKQSIQVDFGGKFICVQRRLNDGHEIFVIPLLIEDPKYSVSQQQVNRLCNLKIKKDLLN